MALRCARRLLKQVFGGCFSHNHADDDVYDEESLAPGPRNAQYFLRDSYKFSGPLETDYFGASTGKAVVIGPADDEGYDYRKSPMPFWARMLLLLFVACSTADGILRVPVAFTKLLPPKPKVKEQTGSSSGDDDEDEEAFLIRAGHRPTALVLPHRALSSVEFLVVCSGSGLAMDTLAGIGFDAPVYSTSGMSTPGMQTMLLLSGAMRPAATGLPLPPATPVDEEVLPPHLRLLLHLHATASSLFTAPTAHDPRPYSPVGPGPTQSTRAAYSLQVQEVDSVPPSPRPSHGCCSPPPCPPSPTPELPLSPRAPGPRTSRPSSPAAAALALRLSPWPEFSSSSSSSSSSASRSPSSSPRAVPCVVQQEEPPAAAAAPSSPAFSMGLREVDASDLLSFTNRDPHKTTNSAASCCTSPHPTPLSPESTMASSTLLHHQQQQQQQPGGLESFSSLSHPGPVLAEEGMAALQQQGQQQAEEEEEEATQPLLLQFELESVDRCHVIASPLLTMVENLLDDEEEEEQQQAAGLCSVDVLESVSLGADTTGAKVPLHHLQPTLQQEEPGLGAAAAFELKVLDCRALLGGGSTFINPTEPVFEDEQLLVVAVQWRGQPRPEVAAEKMLGVGGFAEVRLVGPNQGYDRRYALKLVDLQQFLREGEDGSSLRLSCTAEELQREPLLLAQLARHMDQSADETAFAIRQYGWGVCGPFLFSLQEVAEAGSLKAFEGELADLAALQYVFASMVRALHALLLFGWLHCDVKPGNVLVTRDGQLKLADFNTSVEVWRAAQGHVLASYTEDFAPPEVRRDDLLPADGRADVFGVGATVAKLQNTILKGLLLKPPAKAVREAIKGAMRNLEGGAKVPPRYSYEQLLAMDWLADCPLEAPPTFLSLVDEVCAKADDSMVAEGVQGA